jgi:hypothetical protein
MQVCTFLKPSMVPQPDMLALTDILRFVSEYLGYEPLEQKHFPPEYIQSPVLTLNTQVRFCQCLHCLPIAWHLSGKESCDVLMVFGRRE